MLRKMAKTWLALILFLVSCWIPSFVFAQEITVAAARIWPAEDYTRVTLESKNAIEAKFFTVANPDRLVLDLSQVNDLKILRSLSEHLSATDPYIKAIRIGHFNPTTVRVVFDLKVPVKASSVLLDPVANYGYRYMLDLYPVNPNDPLMSFLAKQEPVTKPSSNQVTVNNQQDKQSDLAQNNKSNLLSNPVNNASLSDQTTSAPSKAVIENDAVSKPIVSTPASHPITAKHDFLIAVDAGHGGEDPGAHGHGGHNEKDVTLAIAKHLSALINEDPSLRAVLIRDGDYFIPLQGRTAKARRLHADMFVSIHADAYVTEDAKGSSVFALSEKGATSVAAKWLAQHENNADLIGGVDLNHKDPYLAQTLFDLSQTATINDSLKLAQSVLTQLHQVNDLHRGRVEQAGFAVLKSPDIPSILVETAFITNPTEEQRLVDSDYQDQLAHAILKGIKTYLANNPPAQNNTVLGTR
ncbi:N-acetylmuramoyl-L-alanine amidase [Ferrovum sp. PN-J185]|uniref:N-acetylmuramoyl-L-alanine amidase n=2 Tax=Ferrovum sp. PN-J185 TaxID=1356306 RepID=UPI000796E67A|nr:N-acetylmuramoyl-L-alanine amidase [Ferrovum sp. PN-J185]KXW55744.1 N-acetylmuramoyl-L-alanine amidase AmiC precursor [Ferrovum sp. PN-J185]